jgi:hypothetical protein
MRTIETVNTRWRKDIKGVLCFYIRRYSCNVLPDLKTAAGTHVLHGLETV